jgi:methylated-DNA-protein-cysteine methyltransferase related protein
VGTDDFRERVIAVLGSLKPGEVVSYGDVATEAGFPGAARAVGALLASEASDGLPWWRVVTASGRLVPGHEEVHASRLRKEGVQVVNGRVRLVRGGGGRKKP